MKRFLVIISIIGLVSAARAGGEIDGEVDISQIAPYNRFAPGFCGVWLPNFLTWHRFSLGAGAAIHIASQFNYDSIYREIPYAPGVDSLLLRLDENFVEIANFDFFTAGHWQFWGYPEAPKWKGWLTLTVGAVINSATKTGIRTENVVDTTAAANILSISKYYVDYPIAYRTEAYLSPGVLIGVGNFYFGYRHWFILDPMEIQKGDPARMVGTLRIGYRFKW